MKQIIFPVEKRNQPLSGPAIIQVSVPWSKGELATSDRVVLRAGDGRKLPAQFQVLNYWPDGSIKWLLCQSIVPEQDELHGPLALQQCDALSTATTVPIAISSDRDHYCVVGGGVSYHIDRQLLRPFSQVVGEHPYHGSAAIELEDVSGRVFQPKIVSSEIVFQGALSAHFGFSGYFQNNTEKLLKFYASLEIWPTLGHVEFSLRLHNPRAAVHPGNIWDLGDPGSVHFKRLDLRIAKERGPYSLNRVPQERLIATASSGQFTLYQESSGGENWDSPVHLNRHDRVPMTVRGWRLYQDEEQVSQGYRCQPQVWAGTGDDGFCVEISNFWQTFPRSLDVDPDNISLGLFPHQFPDSCELQGGEQFSSNMTFAYGRKPDQASMQRVQLVCSLDVYQQSRVLAPALFPHQESAYHPLVDLAFAEKGGFFAKREAVDEYGWRNFGDVYADHETAFHDQPGIFVSHYNNQYDLLSSFYREFLTSGDSRWFELAKDLAAHSADIDVNQTTEDRLEYNLGPFWHTDHYLDAGLSTHRMASSKHLEKKAAHLCGGGPGSEMCYVSGLSLHYLLTGDVRYRELVLQLADWNWKSLNGTQTIGAATLRAVKNFKKLRQSQKLQIVQARYPFTRGTGNCLNSCLEALELSGDELYLQRAEQLIRGTVHPHDNPSKRDLLNAEIAWSYTVFLMVLGRYLLIKQSRGELDVCYFYARDSLVLYAAWMLENEYPYLEKPEILEYPNDTWVAQDLRKSVILYYAANFQEGSVKQDLLAKADRFKWYVLNRLAESNTAYYARIQALILQNGWVADALTLESSEKYCVFNSQEEYPPSQELTLLSLFRFFGADVVSVAKKFNMNNELKWLKDRI